MPTLMLRIMIESTRTPLPGLLQQIASRVIAMITAMIAAMTTMKNGTTLITTAATRKGRKAPRLRSIIVAD